MPFTFSIPVSKSSLSSRRILGPHWQRLLHSRSVRLDIATVVMGENSTTDVSRASGSCSSGERPGTGGSKPSSRSSASRSLLPSSRKAVLRRFSQRRTEAWRLRR